MKIYCEKCKAEISKEVDKRFEKVTLGKIICPKCKAVQKRVILEADLLKYLGICEVIYFFLTLIGIYVYENFINMWWLAIIFICLLVGVAIFQKNLSRSIYNKEPLAITSLNLYDSEEVEKVRKELNTSFLIYFMMAICSIMSANYRLEFMFGLLVISVVTFIKLYKLIKDNKK